MHACVAMHACDTHAADMCIYIYTNMDTEHEVRNMLVQNVFALTSLKLI